MLPLHDYLSSSVPTDIERHRGPRECPFIHRRKSLIIVEIAEKGKERDEKVPYERCMIRPLTSRPFVTLLTTMFAPSIRNCILRKFSCQIGEEKKPQEANGGNRLCRIEQIKMFNCTQCDFIVTSSNEVDFIRQAHMTFLFTLMYSIIVFFLRSL